MSGEGSDIHADTKRVRPLDSVRLDRTAFSVVRLGDESSDRDYWWAQSPQSRLEALELMRQVAFGYDPFTARLQRVLEVVKQPPR